jgi:CRISPR-associated helicase Cas3
MGFNVVRFKEFFRVVTGYTPYDWQVEFAVRLASMGRGVLVLTAETGSGKTEAVLIPNLFLGRQVVIVEPYRAIVEDLEDRVKKYLIRLSKLFGVAYSLGIDYGGEHMMYECFSSGCRVSVSRKPFGADVILTTMDELLYRLLSVGSEKKASYYTTLIRLGEPVVFFDEGYSYVDDVSNVNPFVTLIHEVTSLSLYTSVVVASATIQEHLKEHLKQLATLNNTSYSCYDVPPKVKGVTKALVSFTPEGGVEVIKSKVLELVGEGFKSILVRVIRPETAFKIYSELVSDDLRSKYCIGVLHGRMPIKDRANVLRAVKEDLRGGESVILVATGVIEAGVDLDFDAGVIELLPYGNLVQTLGRVNRKYVKSGCKVILVTPDKNDWLVFGRDIKYLDDLVGKLRSLGGWRSWEEVDKVVVEVDRRYSTFTIKDLINTYTDPYSKLLAVSLYSLFHLKGTMMEYVVGLSKDEYNTRRSLDVLVEIEEEKGNYVRIPKTIAEKLGIKEKKEKISNTILTPHNYIRRKEEIKARGLITPFPRTP